MSMKELIVGVVAIITNPEAKIEETLLGREHLHTVVIANDSALIVCIRPADEDYDYISDSRAYTIAVCPASDAATMVERLSTTPRAKQIDPPASATVFGWGRQNAVIDNITAFARDGMYEVIAKQPWNENDPTIAKLKEQYFRSGLSVLSDCPVALTQLKREKINYADLMATAIAKLENELPMRRHYSGSYSSAVKLREFLVDAAEKPSSIAFNVDLGSWSGIAVQNEHNTVIIYTEEDMAGGEETLFCRIQTNDFNRACIAIKESDAGTLHDLPGECNYLTSRNTVTMNDGNAATLLREAIEALELDIIDMEQNAVGLLRKGALRTPEVCVTVGNYSRQSA